MDYTSLSLPTKN